MTHPTYPLQAEERAELIVAMAYHPEDIPRIRLKYRNYRDWEFPQWLEIYQQEFDAWVESV